MSRALARYRTDRPEEAIADYERILELERAPVEARLKALVNRGALYSRLQRHDAAIGDFDAVLGMRESTPRQRALALFNRADSKSQLGDADGARVDYEAALAQPDLDERIKANLEARLEALPRHPARRNRPKRYW